MIGRRTFLGTLLAGMALPAQARLMVNQLGGFGGVSQAGASGTPIGAPGATVTNAVESNDETGGTIAQSHTVDAGTDCLVVIARTNSSTGSAPTSTISSITFGAVSLDSQTTQTSPDTANHIAIYILLNPAAGTDTITVTESGSSNSKTFTAVNFSGVYTAGPVGTKDGQAADVGTDHTYSATSTIAGSMWVMGDCAHGADTTPFAPAGSITELGDGESGGGGSSNDHGYWAGYLAAATVTSYTLGATATSSDGYAAAAIELIPA